MKHLVLPLAALLLVLGQPAIAQEASAETEVNQEDVGVFRRHVEFLAHPFFKGRLPGTPEMEAARSYVQWHFEQLGLEPAFGGSSKESLAEGADSYRQKFEIGGTRRLSEQALWVDGAEMKSGSDYRGLRSGSTGEVEGEMVFAGYAIERIGDEYSGFDEKDDFSGKVVVLYRYAPMDENGKTLFKARGRSNWPRGANLFFKARQIAERGAAGVIIVSPPGVADEDTDLASFRDRRMEMWDFPAALMSTASFERLLGEAKIDETAMSLRKKADAGRAIVPLGMKAKLKMEIATDPNFAENVGALLRGKGALADQIIVVGAHIDHLGTGRFGSRAGREGRGKIHPGADDNASGTAAIIMMAEKLVDHYAAMPEDASARTVLFIGLDAEEQGLLGARHYTRDPIAPLGVHSLMINFDMIGRVTEKALRVDGANTGSGLAELVRPLFATSGLDIKESERVMMASDHAAFYGVQVPILFGIISNFHNDYHTPRDTADKMNCEDAVRVVDLFTKIVEKVSVHPEQIEFQRPGRN